MTDKKSPLEERNEAPPNSTPDNDHTRTYYAGDQPDGPEEDVEIRPIEAEETPTPPKSQALMDMQEAGLSPEEITAQTAAEEKSATGKSSPQGTASRSGAENLVVIARFRWIFLLVLSVISVAAWTAEAFISDRPYSWESAGWLALTLILTSPLIKFLRLPTRSGLAALFWAGSLFVSALYGPPEFLFGQLHIPAALSWAGLLTLIMLWMGVAIWRKLGRYRVIDLVLSLVLIFAALAPIGALISSITSGAALKMNFAALGSSPASLTAHLPWFLWPLTISVAVILPLCALFSFWDQFSAFRRRGARHGGNFFLALAFIVLIPYAFLSYDQAVVKCPQLAQNIRAVWPAATEHARALPAPSPVVALGQNLVDETAVSTSPPVAEPPSSPMAETPPVLTPEQPPRVAAPAPAPEPELSPPVTPVVPEAPAPVETAPPSPVAPQAVIPAPPSQPVPPAAPEISPPPAALPSPAPTLEERLQSTDERLGEALARIEELEREIKLLKQAAPETETDTPAITLPQAPPSDEATETPDQDSGENI